jgi:hypothetical protein
VETGHARAYIDRVPSDTTSTVRSFEQVNRIYEQCKSMPCTFPLYAWYKRACEFTTDMYERPPVGDETTMAVFEQGRKGQIPAEITTIIGANFV